MESIKIKSVAKGHTSTRCDKLKRSGRRVKILMSWFGIKSVKNLSQFALLSIIHLTSSSWYPALTKNAAKSKNDGVKL